MKKLFHFVKRRRSRPHKVDTQLSELRQGQLAISCYGQRIGGDGYEFVRVSPDKVLFALLDVAGRREKNRTIVAAVQETFRSAGTRLLGKEAVNEADAMVELCLKLNAIVMKTAHRICACPMFAGCYNEKLSTISYFNAGHTPGLLGDPAGVTELHATGLPLGLFSHSTPDAGIVAVPPGGGLLLVSRGVVEAKRKGEEFGLERAKESLRRAVSERAADPSAVLLDALQEFTYKSPIRNDVTVLALTRSARAKAMAG